MKQYPAAQIRNVALAGHGGSGKTAAGEAMLLKAGEIDRVGGVFDYDPEEIKRKVSVSAALHPLEWKGCKLNLLDTPGLFDFAGGMYEGIRAAESVVIAVSSKSGAAVGTEKAFKLARDLNRARMFFVTKMDAENADFYKALDSLRQAFGTSVCPLVVPFMNGEKAESYVDLLEGKAYAYDAKGVAKEIPMPDLGSRYEEYMGLVSEAIAETDEALMEKFFEGEAFTKDELIKGMRLGVASGAIAPVRTTCLRQRTKPEKRRRTPTASLWTWLARTALRSRPMCLRRWRTRLWVS